MGVPQIKADKHVFVMYMYIVHLKRGEWICHHIFKPVFGYNQQIQKTQQVRYDLVQPEVGAVELPGNLCLPKLATSSCWWGSQHREHTKS